MATVMEREVVKGGQPSTPEVQPEHRPQRLPLGPIDTIHVYWLAGMSCDGCTIAVAGATNPGIEGLLAGSGPGDAEGDPAPPRAVGGGRRGVRPVVPRRPRRHPRRALRHRVRGVGTRRADRRAHRRLLLRDGRGGDLGGTGPSQPVPTATWLQRLAPGAAATIAIGTCATWGGIPSAEGNPTGAMSVMDFLGKDYRSAFGLPVINIPGCAPVGDNFTETVFAVLLFLQGLGPLPAFDELGRPAWLFRDTVHHGCTRAGFYEEGIFAERLRRRAVPRRDRLLGAGRQLQHRPARRDQPHGRLHEGGRHLHRLHDAGLPRQVRAVLQDAAGRDRLDLRGQERRRGGPPPPPPVQSRGDRASTAGTCVRRCRAAGRTCSRRRWPIARSNSSTRLAAPGLEEAGTPAGRRGAVLGRRPPRVSARLPRPERRPGGRR